MKVLVVVDFQNDFIDGALGTKEAQNVVDYVKDKINNFNGEIVYTMDTHFENYLKTAEGRNLPVVHCIKNTQGWLIREGVYKENSKIFEKNGFGSLDLAKYLVELNEKEPIDCIEVLGLCTDICVVVNVLLLKTYLPEVEIVVDSRGCAGVTPKTHNASLETMKMCQIKII